MCTQLIKNKITQQSNNNITNAVLQSRPIAAEFSGKLNPPLHSCPFFSTERVVDVLFTFYKMCIQNHLAQKKRTLIEKFGECEISIKSILDASLILKKTRGDLITLKDFELACDL